MRYSLWHIILFVVYTLTANGQSTQPVYNQLYSVSGPGLEGTSYLYGDFYLNEPEMFEFSDSLTTALADCTYFASEVNYDSINVMLQSFLKSEPTDIEDDDTVDPEAPFDSYLNMYNPDGMPSTVDAYLYKVAMANKYKIFGLQNEGFENINNQYRESIHFGTQLYIAIKHKQSMAALTLQQIYLSIITY